MSPPDVLQLGREVLLVALVLALPPVVVSLLVGVLISVLQVATSIQEQTLSFVPRILAVALTMWLTFPWTVRVLSAFSLRVVTHMVEVGQ